MKTKLTSLFLFAAFLFIGKLNVNAQEIKFDTLEINYGKIDKGANGIREFKFTNTGDQPLIISNAKGSCGCTVPTWPKEPIEKKGTGVISVKYDTQRVGAFSKNVTLTTNAKSGATTVLKIYGEVKDVPSMTPSAPKSILETGNN